MACFTSLPLVNAAADRAAAHEIKAPVNSCKLGLSIAPWLEAVQAAGRLAEHWS